MADCEHNAGCTRCYTEPEKSCMKRKTKQPSPGSDAAIDGGCLCPVLDNGHGRGYMGLKGIYVMRADCPLHGHEARTPSDGVNRSFGSGG